MSKEKREHVLLIAGSCAFHGDVAKVEAKFDEVVSKFVKDGWIKPEFVQRHQQGYVMRIWLEHSKRLNAKKLPAKMSIGIQESVAI